MMFNTDDVNQLQRAICAFDVPMFIAERAKPQSDFRLLCLNSAHERITGLNTQEIIGARPRDILPLKDAASVEERYADCAERRDIIKYRETLNIGGAPTEWSTTLQPIEMPRGRQRVVGTAVPVQLSLTMAAFEDVDFFARTATMQVGKIASFLNVLEERNDLPGEVYEGASIVTNLCRSVENVLRDIRRAGHRGFDAQNEDAAPRLYAQNDQFGGVSQ